MDFSKRCYDPEIMDDLDMKGDELAETLSQIAMVNRWLGGSAVALDGVKRLLKKEKSTPNSLTIVDIGCGGGEILRKIADWAKTQGITVQLLGLDANAFTVDYAKEQCKSYPEIQFRQINVFSEEFAALKYDIALCSLFLHHFTEDEIIDILKKIQQSSSIGFVINDLQRSALAYYLFHFVTLVLGASKMVRYDGKLSIRRGFSKKELLALCTASGIKYHQITWRWAFRWEALGWSF